MKLSKEVIDRLKSDDITVKEHREIIELIELGFTNVMKKITTHLSWYDFDNGDEDEDGGFEINSYEDRIGFYGEFRLLPFLIGDDSFPTRWLYEDFQEELTEMESVYTMKKELEIERRKLKRQKHKDMVDQIKSKLTKEELRYVNFR